MHNVLTASHRTNYPSRKGWVFFLPGHLGKICREACFVFIWLLAGCDTTPAVPAENTSEPAAVFVQPAFSEAMSTKTPLARIEGVSKPAEFEFSDDSERYVQAIEYARAAQSYALLIWQGGALRVEAYYQGFDKNLRPDSASMHKSVVGLLAAAALSDGTIESVTDPIRTYIPEWKDDPRGDIRIEDLLNMTSGLGNLSFAGGATAPGTLYVIEGDKARAKTLALSLEHPPGTKFQYANTVTQLLVMVLEAASGKSYSKFLSERLWQPIGASDAYVWLNEEEGFPRGFTSLLAKPRDWLRLGLLIKDYGSLDGTQIVSRDIIDRATAPSAANPNYGWQIWRGEIYEPKRYYNDDQSGIGIPASAPYLASDILFFDGFGGQRVYISRAHDLVIVRLGDARMDWDDAVLPNFVLEALDE